MFYNIFQKSMEQLIQKMYNIQDGYTKIKKWCLKNQIDQPKIMGYSLQKISKLYDNFTEKYGAHLKESDLSKDLSQPIWFENELILFYWAVLILSLTESIDIKDFKNREIIFLSKIFREKSEYIIQYQIKCMLIRGKQIRIPWKAQEQKLLGSILAIMPQKNKWNQIARQLFKQSEGRYLRQGKHCRERWYTYMENKKVQNVWNLQDDIKLLETVKQKGKKWAQIVSSFSNVQNKKSLKKRYNQLLRETKQQNQDFPSQKIAINFLLLQKQKLLRYQKKNNIFCCQQPLLAQVQKSQSMIDDSNENQEQNIQSQNQLQFYLNNYGLVEQKLNTIQNPVNQIVSFPNEYQWISVPLDYNMIQPILNMNYYQHQVPVLNATFEKQNYLQSVNYPQNLSPFSMGEGYFFY